MLVAVDLFACSIPEVARALRAAHLGALRAARTTVQSEGSAARGIRSYRFPVLCFFLYATATLLNHIITPRAASRTFHALLTSNLKISREVGHPAGPIALIDPYRDASACSSTAGARRAGWRAHP